MAEKKPTLGKKLQIRSNYIGVGKFWLNVVNILTKHLNFCEDVESGAVQKCANLVDLKKMLQNEYLPAKSASIHPRTIPPKLYSYILSSHRFWSTNIIYEIPYFAAW